MSQVPDRARPCESRTGCTSPPSGPSPSTHPSPVPDPLPTHACTWPGHAARCGRGFRQHRCVWLLVLCGEHHAHHLGSGVRAVAHPRRHESIPVLLQGTRSRAYDVSSAILRGMCLFHAPAIASPAGCHPAPPQDPAQCAKVGGDIQQNPAFVGAGWRRCDSSQARLPGLAQLLGDIPQAARFVDALRSTNFSSLPGNQITGACWRWVGRVRRGRPAGGRHRNTGRSAPGV